MSMGLFSLNIYLRVPGYPTNYPIGYPGNKLPGYGSRSVEDTWLPMMQWVCGRCVEGDVVR